MPLRCTSAILGVFNTEAEAPELAAVATTDQAGNTQAPDPRQIGSNPDRA